ncbi:branched-chain amino acid ABC transporter permease [Sneathiella glossodoripedis]|uniref:branched-chain amino acid ABC transporter permease n=1 Tax=Sneathiella glossodoripedis TaxID=418853 RepID=UPI0004704C38|nr:branched-chain amino acid ABC transporter permease [Sneathiella glossodoripedis]
MDIIIPLVDASSYILILIMIALGLMIVFGMMGVINMAHGELFMIGAYVMVLCQSHNLPFWLGLVLAPIMVAFIGLLIETLLIRHIYQRPLDTILATWGLSIALKQAIVLVFGPEAQSVSAPVDESFSIGDFSYPIYRLFIMAASLFMIIATFWIFLKTDFGLMARAVIARPHTSETLGINTRRIYRWSFVFGTALAGLAGALIAPTISVDPQMGLGYLVPGFLSILVGGTGPLAGVLAGAGAIGGTNSLLSVWVSPVAAQIAVFILAIIIIRMRPSGLLGERDEK